MKKGPLLQLLLTSPPQTLTLVIPKSLTLHNLHRVIQICLKPTILETTIDKKWSTVEFTSAEGAKVKKLKSGKIDVLGDSSKEGTEFKYSCDGKTFTIKVETHIPEGDTINFIPRCINITSDETENIDINAINKKLLFKRFGANPSTNKKPRQAPKIIVMDGEPDHMIWKTYFNAMREPAKAWDDIDSD